MTERTPASRRHKMLISYHYARGKDLGELVGRHFATFPQIFGDSGAFSALSLGKPITVEEYGGWLAVNKRHLACYANLDVIKDPEATARNQRRLEAMGHAPLPVFHTGSDFRHLDALIAGYPYVCLGGCVGYDAKRLMPWLVACHQRARAAGNGTVFHGFGLTQAETIRSLPWYSVDSSSWGMGYRYGRLDLFDRRTGKFVKMRMFDRKEVAACAGLIRDHGADPGVFLTRAAYHHRHAVAVAATAWRRLEGWMRRRHGEQPFPGGAVPPGPTIYLASTGGDLGPDRLRAVASSVGSGPHLYLADTNLTNHATANRSIAS